LDWLDRDGDLKHPARGFFLISIGRTTVYFMRRLVFHYPSGRMDKPTLDGLQSAITEGRTRD
jgi:hypothetical protein